MKYEGTESRLEDCDIRMNGQAYNHVYSCPWDGNFVYIHCGDKDETAPASEYWGGIRFSVPTFEENLLEMRRLGLPLQADRSVERQSKLYYVDITAAGMLHGEKSPAVLSVLRSPSIQQVNISHCASDGISFVSPSTHLPLIDNRWYYQLVIISGLIIIIISCYYFLFLFISVIHYYYLFEKLGVVYSFLLID